MSVNKPNALFRYGKQFVQISRIIRFIDFGEEGDRTLFVGMNVDGCDTISQKGYDG